jgi:hypothetical protein
VFGPGALVSFFNISLEKKKEKKKKKKKKKEWSQVYADDYYHS